MVRYESTGIADICCAYTVPTPQKEMPTQRQQIHPWHVLCCYHCCNTTVVCIAVWVSWCLHTLTCAFCNSITGLFDDPLSSDVAIKAGDTTVHAHKPILVVLWPSFKAMFQVSAVHTGGHSVSSVVGHVEHCQLGRNSSHMIGSAEAHSTWHVHSCTTHKAGRHLCHLLRHADQSFA